MIYSEGRVGIGVAVVRSVERRLKLAGGGLAAFRRNWEKPAIPLGGGFGVAGSVLLQSGRYLLHIWFA